MVCEAASAPGRTALGEGLCPALESILDALALGMPALALPTRDLRTVISDGAVRVTELPGWPKAALTLLIQRHKSCVSTQQKGH